MDLFWSGATPIFTIFLCRMTRMVKIVTRPKTMVNFIFFPSRWKFGPDRQQNGGGIVVIPPPRFTLSASSSVGLSAWRWACAVPRCGSMWPRSGQRKQQIRTPRQSALGSDLLRLSFVAEKDTARKALRLNGFRVLRNLYFCFSALFSSHFRTPILTY